MPGNALLYMQYTIFMIIALIVLCVIILIKKDRGNTRKFLTILIPIVILFQFYFWNLDFNDYVKSFLFPSRVFECGYEEKLENISIPLPERTVFHGKQDVCSPFYSTYVDDSDFKSFYQEKLKTMKSRGEIQRYNYIEHKDNYWAENKGFVVDLPSGLQVEIFIKRSEGSDKGQITIDYKPNN